MLDRETNWKLERCNAVYSLLSKDNGCSVNLRTNAPNDKEDGFYVSTSTLGIFDSIPDVSVATFYNKIPDNPPENMYLGGWKHPETNKFYIELSLWIKDYFEALVVGKNFYQEYIWDIANKVEFKVEDALNVR